MMPTSLTKPVKLATCLSCQAVYEIEASGVISSVSRGAAIGTVKPDRVSAVPVSSLSACTDDASRRGPARKMPHAPLSREPLRSKPKSSSRQIAAGDRGIMPQASVRADLGNSPYVASGSGGLPVAARRYG